MSDTMKALWLHEPWPVLIELGVKTFETRGLPPNGPMRPDGMRGFPGLQIEPGERVAIVAAMKKPKDGLAIGDWQVESWRDEPAERCLVHVDDLSGRRRVWPLPLGVVVCTARLMGALPMTDGDTCPDYPHIAIRPSGTAVAAATGDVVGTTVLLLGALLHCGGQRNWALVPSDISDQLPYGHWEPGRWAWRLANVESVPGRPKPVITRGNPQGVCEIEVTW